MKDNGSVRLGATSTCCASIVGGLTISAALLESISANSSEAWSIVRLLAFMVCSFLCSFSTCSALGAVGGDKDGGGKLGLYLQGICEINHLLLMCVVLTCD